jgi:hypothetical protein
MRDTMTTLTEGERETFTMAPQRGKPPEGYYSASTTLRKLGNISDGMLRSYIQRGLIERYVPPGRKQGFYSRSQVDKLARELESALYGGTKAPQTHFRQATSADIEAIIDIDERTFNALEEEPVPRKTYLEWNRETYLHWMQRNPQTFFVLLSATEKIVGFASLLPLKRDILNHLIRGEIKWTDISEEDIDLFEPGKPLHLYVIALCIDPVLKGAIKETYGSRIISSIFKWFLMLAKQGIEIETITARNDLNHPDGKRLLLKLGIPQLRSPVKDMHLFSVRVPESGNTLLVKYYDTLVEWKNQHKEI